MGCFDTFVGNVECPHCKENTSFYEQTKRYGCFMQDFKVGDYIDKSNANYFYKFEYPCQYCKEDVTIYTAVKRGQLIGYYTDVSGLDINTMENIEENYQRKLEYRAMCEAGYGTDKCIYEENKSFAVGDTIDILGRDWIVETVFEERVNQNIGNKRLLNFYNIIFSENRCYKVHDNHGNKRMIITRKFAPTYVTGLIDQNGYQYIDGYVAFCGQIGTELVEIHT